MKHTQQYDFAMDAARRGWAIFPCEEGEKVGAFTQPGGPFRIKWYETATTDPAKIQNWWENVNPRFNIGISCKKSSLLVVDCDVPKNWGAEVQSDGVENFRALVEQHHVSWDATIDTYQVETASGGIHLYYEWPSDVQASQRPIAPMVDVRSNGGTKGGYVVGAGSTVNAGHYNVINPAKVAPVPGWLLEVVTEEPENPIQEALDAFQRAHSAGLGGLHSFLTAAPEGRRNEFLFWVAAQAAEENPEWSAEDLVDEFGQEASEIGLTWNEIRATIRSAHRKGRR